ncbi:hypothetical protein T552_01087 [Pneumocystis carinii B80]|uniref:Dihydrofolate synthetase n=2 Tax=Pneumocystis carinii TaxID=4754 RepID=A0A0W4ZND3_PNEC8|nr:hypothetical protein T552_01087 [Pneumocystis carinii B80]AAZ91473.1 dihydrofolate synthase [Pneumocystis carinii]KTW29883.1 hypothetical protein T552_01087 [Pneumocystis carinii B80]
MLVKLGLLRIRQLLKYLGNPQNSFQAVHVAGTNGKGSVCAYLSSCLALSGIRVGQYCSPHLIDRWDCVKVIGRDIDKHQFLEIESKIKNLNQRCNIGATEFEIMTAVAFEILSKNNVELAVIETGVGGRLDATNVLSQVLLTIITKISMDHQELLGNTIQKIAREKSGIMKKNIPCIVDGTNEDSVLKVIKEESIKSGSSRVILTPMDLDKSLYIQEWKKHEFKTSLYRTYQRTNLACVSASLEILSKYYPKITPDILSKGLLETYWPGRLEWIDLSQIAFGANKILLDGAHNIDGINSLSEYINSIRNGVQSVSWLTAFTQGKDVDSLLSILLKPYDKIHSVEFEPVDGMQWIKPVNSSEIAKIARKYLYEENVKQHGTDLLSAIRSISQDKGLQVICGSLYLIGQVHRLLHKRILLQKGSRK